MLSPLSNSRVIGAVLFFTSDQHADTELGHLWSGRPVACLSLLFSIRILFGRWGPDYATSSEAEQTYVKRYNMHRVGN